MTYYASIPKRIGFFTSGPQFNGGTIKHKALGGSETALIQAANALARLGHKVTVYNNTDHDGVFDGVRYCPSRFFPKAALTEGFEIFIVSRYFGFFSLPIPSRVKVLWNHDMLDRPRELTGFLDQIDTMFVLSMFHRNNYLTHLPDAAGKMFVTRNGIDFNLIDNAIQGVIRQPGKVIYASRPERGLKVLLEDIWPNLLQARPDLTLYICGYDVDRSDLDPVLVKLYGYLDELLRSTDNVVSLGSLAKADYYYHLASSALMLYPCHFPEISCITALEAQACRTPILTTDAFALAETVMDHDLLIPGRPGRDEYNRTFIQKALDLLDHPEQTTSLMDNVRALMEIPYSWPDIIAEWDRLFDLALASQRSKQRIHPPKMRSYGG